jgi:hypothetical protein
MVTPGSGFNGMFSQPRMATYGGRSRPTSPGATGGSLDRMMRPPQQQQPQAQPQMRRPPAPQAPTAIGPMAGAAETPLQPPAPIAAPEQSAPAAPAPPDWQQQLAQFYQQPQAAPPAPETSSIQPLNGGPVDAGYGVNQALMEQYQQMQRPGGEQMRPGGPPMRRPLNMRGY